MSEHTRLSPSAAHRWLQCPGSIRLSDLVEREFEGADSFYAREGTLAHDIAEIEASFAFKHDSAAKHKQRVLHWKNIATAGGYDTDEMLRHAAEYVQVLTDLAEENEGSQVMLEQKVDPRVPGSGGTADAIIVSETHLHVVDYKYGKGIPVYAQDNPQLKLYAVGALEDFGDLLGDVETVCLSVHQPRIDNMSHSCMEAVELRRWRDSILPKAKLALSGEGYLAPSESACRFCPASGECKARADFVVQRDFGSPDLMNPDELAAALDDVAAIKDWCLKVQETALRKAYIDGVDLPGWKVVMSGGRRSISDHKAALDALSEAGFDLEETSRFTTRPLGELEKIVGGRASLDAILGVIVTKSEPKESLVPEDDKRSGVTALDGAAEDFSK